ncbi:unnamed protein product, partial [Nesidiocoris tenuis]
MIPLRNRCWKWLARGSLRPLAISDPLSQVAAHGAWLLRSSRAEGVDSFASKSGTAGVSLHSIPGHRG